MFRPSNFSLSHCRMHILLDSCYTYWSNNIRIVWEFFLIFYIYRVSHRYVNKFRPNFAIFKSTWGGMAQNHFSVLIPFFKLQFKTTSNLSLLSFKMSSESFLFENFKTGLTFWHMWFFNFQNLVRTCQHIGGTPCILINLYQHFCIYIHLPNPR